MQWNRGEPGVTARFKTPTEEPSQAICSRKDEVLRGRSVDSGLSLPLSDGWIL